MMKTKPSQPQLPPITILGAGGIGCTLAATIHHSGHPVKLVEICRSKLSWAKMNGIEVPGFHLNQYRLRALTNGYREKAI